jgi:copper(I)-binding protein
VTVLKELPGGPGPIRRFSVAAAAAVAGTLLLVGCAAGQNAQTVGQQPPIDGTSASAGDIAIRAAGVITPANGQSYDKGASALLQLVLVNNGATDTTLTSVSSPVAGNAVVSNSGSPDASAATSDSASASDSGSGSASDSASASASATVSSSGAEPSATGSPIPGSVPIQLPAGQSVQIGFSNDGPSISLNSLTAALFPAQTVPVTFTFGNGSTVTTNLTVKLSTEAPSAPVISDATAAND